MPSWKNLTSLRHVTLRMGFVLAVFSVCTFAYGFDNVVFSTIQAMDAFEKKFGEYDQETKKYHFSALHLSFLNSLGLPAKALGVVVVCIVGVGVAHGAKSYAMILSGRIIVQAFVGWNTLLVPMYTAEIAPGHIRGAMVGLYVFSHQFGAFLCSFVTYSSSKYTDSDYSWQLPIAIGFIFPGLMFIFAWFIPESPRWLVRQNKHAQAAKALHFLMDGTNGFDVDREIGLLEMSLEEDASTKGTWMDLIRGTNRMRTFVSCMAGVFNQLTGQSFTTQYGAIFVKGLHAMNPFIFTIISRLGQALGPTLTFALVDVVGRRPLYLVLAVGCCAVLMTDGGLGTGTIDHNKTNGILAMTILFGFFYSAGFGSLGAIISAEVPHLRLRDKTNIVVYVLHTVCDFVVTFTLPYLLDDSHAGLGSRVGFIYGSISFLGIIWGYYFVPETMNRSLEELEEIWRAKVPPRKFRSYDNPAGIGALVTETEHGIDVDKRDPLDGSVEQVENGKK